MAGGKAEETLEKQIEELLDKHEAGLGAGEIARRLGIRSERSVRDVLNYMVKIGKVCRERVRTGSLGKPPYVYLAAANASHQLRLFEDVELEVTTKTDASLEHLDQAERKRLEQGLNALESIAREHVQQDRFVQAILQVGKRLAEEKPAELLVAMAEWMIEDINQSADELEQLIRERRDDVRQIDNAVGRLTDQLQMARQYFQGVWRLEQSYQGQEVMVLPASADEVVRHGTRGRIDADRAKKVLATRIEGERVVNEWRLRGSAPLAAVGTDASVADLQLQHASGQFMRPDPVAVTTAAAAQVVREEGSIVGEYQDFDIFPDNLREYQERAAARHGLVISPMMREVLPEGDFKHTRLAAMDLRQYKEDLRVMIGDAAWRPVGELEYLEPMRTELLIRDGRVFPLVHRLNDYEDDGLYGEIVRNEIETFATVIHQTQGPRHQVYAGAVKDPQQSWLAPLVFWYAYRHQKQNMVSKEDVYRYPFSDTVVSHLLFLSVARGRGRFDEGAVWVTFRAKRRFSDIALASSEVPMVKVQGGYRVIDENSREDWELYIQQRLQEKQQRMRSSPLQRVEQYGSFIYLCQQVGVSMFYAAPQRAYQALAGDEHEGGHFLLCRLEVATIVNEDMREKEDVDKLLGWLATGGVDLDRAHSQTGYEGRSRIPILVPDVIVKVHEAVTFARSKLSEEVEDELRKLIEMLRRKTRET